MGKWGIWLWSAWERLTDVFALDLRSIALWRMLAGLLVMLDIIMKWEMLPALYSDYGLLRNEFWDTVNPHPEYWTIHIGNRTTTFAYVMGVLQLVVGASLMVGFKTRMNAVLAWVLIASGVGRIPYIISGADNMLRVMLFWTMFLPLEQVFSVDAKLKTGDWLGGVTNFRVANGATVGYMLQLCWIYTSAVWWKSNEVWWLAAPDGMTPVYRALSLDSFRAPLGDLIYQSQGLMKLLGLFTLAVQYICPILVFLPIKLHRHWPRLVGALGFFGLQLGFGMAMTLGIFPFVGMLTVAPLLPSFIWKTEPRHEIMMMPEVNWGTRFASAAKASLSVALIALVSMVVIWDIEGHINDGRGSEPYQHLLPMKAKKFGMALMLNQNWRMFDKPALIDAWLRAPGRTVSGTAVDVWQSFIYQEVRPPESTRPAVLRDEFPTNRWRKLIRGLDDESSNAYALRRELFAGYMCRWWRDNLSHEHGKLESFQLDWYKERTKSNYATEDMGSELYGQYTCEA